MTDTDIDETTPRSDLVRLVDFVLFFFGRRESILRLVDSTNGLWLAAMLVFSAAIAREYDAESLVHEPWHLLGPFGASIIVATLLFGITQWCRAIARQQIGDAVGDYRAFLTGYWLTAPLAWFYAVPVESMTDEVSAVKYNLTALSVVSLWRVFLFSRVVSVRFRLPWWAGIVWIGLPCSLIGFIGAFHASMTLIPIMGGLRLTEAQMVVRDYQSNVILILFYAIPVLFVFWIASWVALRKHSKRLEHTASPRHRLPVSIWVIPIAALLVLSFAALQFQPLLYRARVVDRLLADEHLDKALAHLMTHRRSDYPPNWDPPPKYPLGNSHVPTLEELIDTLMEAKSPQWVNDLLLHQSFEIMLRQSGMGFATHDLEQIQRNLEVYSDETWQQIERTVNKLQGLEVGDQRDREAYRKLLEYADLRGRKPESEATE